MKDVVVGLDGSDESSKALDYAVAEARTSGRGVLAVHAWTTPVWVGGIPGFGYNALASPEDSKQFATELVDHQVEQFHARTPSEATTPLRSLTVQGDAKHALVEASKDAALVVVGSRGVGQVHGLLLGSVAQHLLFHAVCPVMLVPIHAAKPGSVRRVVVGADGSAASRSAMHWALDSARRHECPLVVVHSWLLTTLPSQPSVHIVPSLREYETEAEVWLEKELDEVLPDRDGVEVTTELSYSSAPIALREATGPDDQLVVGNRGRGGFARLLLGSVASQCAHYAKGVIVVVRAGEERCET